MADPRNAVSFKGLGYDAQTYHIDNSTITYDSTQANGSAQVGMAVTLSADATVELVGDGEAVLGKLIKVESDNKAIVQTGGHMELPGGAAATLTLGSKVVGGLGAGSAEGYVRAVDSVTAAELAVARGMIIDASDTTAVVVRMEKGGHY